MAVKPLLTVVSSAALLLSLAASGPSLAQSVYPGGADAPASGSYAAPPHPRGRPEIVITPRPLLYRRCADWLELQNRPSGRVLFPRYSCWWVRGWPSFRGAGIRPRARNP